MALNEAPNGGTMLTNRDMLFRIDAKLDAYEARQNALEQRVTVLETERAAAQRTQTRQDQLGTAVRAMWFTGGVGALGVVVNAVLNLGRHQP